MRTSPSASFLRRARRFSVFTSLVMCVASLHASGPANPSNTRLLHPKDVSIGVIGGAGAPLYIPVYTLPENLQNTSSAEEKATVNSAGPQAGPTLIVQEGFEGLWPAPLWITVAGGAGCNWAPTILGSPQFGTKSVSPVGAGCAGIPAFSYPNNMGNLMYYGPFDLSDAAQAELSFRIKHELGNGDDALQVIYSTNGSNWYGLEEFTGGDFTWGLEEAPLSFLSGEATVFVMFRMTSDNVTSAARGLLIDEVRIEKTVGPPAADLELRLIDAVGGSYTRGQEIIVSTTVANIGSAASSAGASVDYYASLNSLITDSDPFLGTCTSIPAIPVRQFGSFDCTVRIPWDMPNGQYHIGGILNTTDFDNTNHVNYDATKVTVFTPPDIRVSPLSMTFVEEAPVQTASPAAHVASVSGPEMDDDIMSSLLQKASRQGSVRVIVGLESAFQPQGLLEASAQARQREDIAEAGNRLIAEVQGLGAKIRHQYRSIPYVAMQVNTRALEHLQRSPLTRSIRLDSANKPTMASSNPVIGSQDAWAAGYDGSGWAVAVLDTGVEKTHSWFTTGGSKVVSEACYSSEDAGKIESLCPGGAASSTAVDSGLNCDNNVTGCSHGTHVAGIVAGNDDNGPDYGAARGADIIAMQVFSKALTQAGCGAGNAFPCVRAFNSDLIAALERVLTLSGSMNIAAVNMSLGSGRYTSQAACDLADPAMKDVIDNLRAVDIATVVASGNDYFSDAIFFPACISSAVSVGATRDDDSVAGFSNVYPELHLLAPGVDIDASLPGNTVGSQQGTSMAAPHVAGAWAVLKQANPGATVDDILSALQTTGTPVDDLRPARTDNDGVEQPAGIETDIPRINVDLALEGRRTAFGIFNDGPGLLTVSSIQPLTTAPWLSIHPLPPYSIKVGDLQAVNVVVDYSQAPEGSSQVRLLVNSDDPDEPVYPGGVFINVTKLPPTSPEFESTPAPNATLGLGTTRIGNSSAEKTIEVNNLGTAGLTIGCSKSGSHPADFTIVACASPVAPAGSTDISITCAPSAAGAREATLNVSTNDADESSVSYALTCSGVVAPVGDDVFADGFEDTL